MTGWKRVLWTLGLVFGTTFATQMLATGFDIFSLDVGTTQAAINSAVAAVLAWGINAGSPWIKQYGYTGEPKA